MTAIDLELAQELQSVCKEKGIELLDHYWGWFYQEITESNILLSMFSNSLSEYIAPAYTLDELLEWLPNKVFHEECNKHYYLQLDKQSDNTYLASYQVFDSYPDDTYYEFDFLQECGDTNPANAACKLLIWLIKEGLI